MRASAPCGVSGGGGSSDRLGRMFLAKPAPGRIGGLLIAPDRLAGKRNDIPAEGRAVGQIFHRREHVRAKRPLGMGDDHWCVEQRHKLAAHVDLAALAADENRNRRPRGPAHDFAGLGGGQWHDVQRRVGRRRGRSVRLAAAGALAPHDDLRGRGLVPFGRARSRVCGFHHKYCIVHVRGAIRRQWGVDRPAKHSIGRYGSKRRGRGVGCLVAIDGLRRLHILGGTRRCRHRDGSGWLVHVHEQMGISEIARGQFGAGDDDACAETGEDPQP